MHIGSYELEATKLALMGIVNVTPDSFSDGGTFFKASDAVDHALKLEQDGADIIDIGGESSRPGSEPVSCTEEIERVVPVIEGIRKRSSVPISIDTTKAPVANLAIESGANMVNDISAGQFDPAILQVVAEANIPICLMHMQGVPKTMQELPRYNNLIDDISSFLSAAINRTLKAGVNINNIIIDPGIGFGKTVEDNVMILKNLESFKKLNRHLMVGASRKSFIGKLLGLDVKERLEATLATIPTSIEGGASIIRVHDVKASRRFIDMYMILR